MYYEFLEDIARTNRLRSVHPAIKLLTGLGCMLISVSSKSVITPLLIAILLFFAVVFVAGINPFFYLKLLFIPAGFAVISVIVIIFMRNSGDILFSLPVFDLFFINISTGSINEGALILSRVLGGMCSLFFISLTTPVSDTFGLLAKCRIPHELIDLSMLIYRFIFVFIEQAVLIYNAQKMRLGYTNLKEGINSFGYMSGALFMNTWNTAENLILAMDSRCYNGKFAVDDDGFTLSLPLLFAVLAFLALLAGVCVTTSEYTIFCGA
ncbi:MAG: cobalt ECF transporter T component CbiQ [Methanomicrobium sp.]|nr:cobalt ECF transporter T component CbiQ [Methanomicrobium sp.]